MDAKTEKQLWKLHDALVEKRSDIAEILANIIEGRKWSVKQIEHRFITADIPPGATRMQYDTLTTIVAFWVGDGQWVEPMKEKYT